MRSSECIVRLIALLALIQCLASATTAADPCPLGSSIPFSTRAYWIRAAISTAVNASGSPCPFSAFGAVVVNHTGTNGLGDLICTGANSIIRTGNPTLHAEIAAINNCTEILTNLEGQYKLNGSQASMALQSLSLYTTAEPCPMCSSAIRWGGFKECIFASSIDTLSFFGWTQIDVTASSIFEHSGSLGTETLLFDKILVNETNPLFAWQFDKSNACPIGCSRSSPGESCKPDKTPS